MSDRLITSSVSLVDRLRAEAKSYKTDVYGIPSLMNEAADAIERINRQCTDVVNDWRERALSAEQSIGSLERRITELNPSEVFSSSTPLGGHSAYQTAIERMIAMRDAIRAMRRVKRPDMHMTLAFPDDGIGPCYLVPTEDFDRLRSLVKGPTDE